MQNMILDEVLTMLKEHRLVDNESERPAKPTWKGLTIDGTLNRVERRSKARAHRVG